MRLAQAVAAAAVAPPMSTVFDRASTYYPASVLPELIVSWLFAVPTLAARVCLGVRYKEWLREQPERGSNKQQKSGVGDTKEKQKKGAGGRGSGGDDAEANIV